MCINMYYFAAKYNLHLNDDYWACWQLAAACCPLYQNDDEVEWTWS